MTRIRTAFRFLSIFAHLLSGVLTVLLLFPFLDTAEREKRLVRWSGRLLKISGVSVTVRGRPPVVRGKGVLIVANHVSWLDIHLIHSLMPARFISKAEVSDWPVIGWLADKAGRTLFLERTRKADAKRVNQNMADHLKAGECLALFPEGTTTDGSGMQPFYASLFQPAVEAGAMVCPALIRYLTVEGERSEAAAYYGDISLLDSARRILSQRGIRAEVTFLPVIHSKGLHRRELAATSEQVIRELLAAGGRDSQPGSAGRLQA